MPLAPVNVRSSLADEVFAQLIGEILDGRYRTGDYLPPERTLTEVFQVNRHVVREALKRLAQVGMVEASQGGGTRVLDYEKHGGLDLIPWLGRRVHGSPEAMMLWRSVLEMRAAIAVDLVRLCTLRASKAIRQDIHAIAQEIARMGAQHRDPAELFDGEVRFWYRVVDGSENVAYRLALNGVLRGASVNLKRTHTFAAWESKMAGYRVPLAEQILAEDVPAAEAEARRTMQGALEAFYGLLKAGRASGGVEAEATTASRAAADEDEAGEEGSADESV